MGRTLDIEATRLIQETLEAAESGKRYIVHEGGTRSSKTHSIIQAIIVWALSSKLEIHVVRESMPTLRRSAMDDWQKQLEEHGLYSERLHNKTENIYHLGASEVLFFGADEEQKLRGPERDILWINEANEITESIWKQLRRRTRKFIVLDYNPSHGATHWIDQEVIGSGREVVIRSTYRDNPFLPDAQVEDIESDVPRYREPDGVVVTDWDLEYEGPGVLISGDPAQWAVNGLGKRARAEEIIHKHWSKIDRMPDGLTDECYGLDFGYSHPCALVHVGWKDVVGEDVNLIWHEVLYKRGLTDAKLIGALEDRGIDKRMPMYCDDAEPERIQALCDAGYNAHPARKSVTDGILTVKDHRLRITRSSVNLIYEIERYKRKKDKDGNILEEPVKKDDHGMDAGRYGTHTHLKTPRQTGGAVSTLRGEGTDAKQQNGLLVSMR